VILIIAGPSGSGKTTVGAMLAGRLHWAFADADSFHPAANIQKMRDGHPLTDADRWPWLDAICAWIDERIAAGQAAVVTCSALRRAYREKLLAGRPEARMVFLLADRETLAGHLTGRHGHFFPRDLLDSQLADLEVPHGEKNVIVVAPDDSPEDTVDKILGILAELVPAALRGRSPGQDGP
jgi:gluconokinase